MLTAHTVTDSQIRALARTALTASQHKDCDIALRARREMLTFVAGRLAAYYPTTKDRRAARARCAEILNARAAATLTRCPDCNTPTHASESDDDGRCVSCMRAAGVEPITEGA